MNERAAILAFLQPLRGSRCVAASGATLATTCSLRFDGDVLRSIRGGRDGAAARAKGDQAHVLIWCTWRLDQQGMDPTGSDDTRRSVRRRIKKLVGLKVAAVEVTSSSRDWNLRFEDGGMLRVFCDYLGKKPTFRINWQMSTPTHALTVRSGLGMEVFTRSPWRRLDLARIHRTRGWPYAAS